MSSAENCLLDPGRWRQYILSDLGTPETVKKELREVKCLGYYLDPAATMIWTRLTGQKWIKDG